MGSIQGLGSSNSAWSAVSHQRTARPPGGRDGGGGTEGATFQDKLFSRLDSDSSGGIDNAELQGLLDKLGSKLGTAVGGSDPAATFSAMDGNGDGSLDKSELDSGLKAALADLPDTVSFARSRGDGSSDGAGRAGGPPPGGGAHGAKGSGGGDVGDASSTSASTDPLDTDGDGTVSASERAAGELKEVLQSLMQAVDSDSDGQVSSGEAKRFGELLAQMTGSSGSSGSSGSGNTADSQRGHRGGQAGGERALADQVLRHYAQASASASASAGSSLNAEA